MRQRDPEAIASQVNSVLDQPEIRQATSKRGPVVAHERFGIERMLRETLHVYGYAPAQGGFGRDAEHAADVTATYRDVAEPRAN